MADSSSARESGPTDASLTRVRAAVGRLEAIQARLSLIGTYCAVAENYIALGRFHEARRALHNSRRIGEYVRRHLQIPNHVPATLVAPTQEQLAKLENRLVSVAMRLPKEVVPRLRRSA